ncbi:MAG: aspartate 1-decarboxylase [Pseudomonadota bacterium]
MSSRKMCFVPQRRVLAVLRGKIHTLYYDYSGSWDIPIDWLQQCGMFPFQKIALMNPRPISQARDRTLYTYVLPAPRGSAVMNANGGIAHYFEAGGEVIIQSVGTFIDAAKCALQQPFFLDTRSKKDILPHQTVYADWMDFVAGKLHFATVNAVIASPHEISGDQRRAAAVLSYMNESSGNNDLAMMMLGQPICILSQDLADLVGFESFEAISLYPANGNVRFNISVMCWVIPTTTVTANTFILVGEGLSDIVHPGDKMIACRYTSLALEKIYCHKADVHILNDENKTIKKVEYCMSDYISEDLQWIV